MRRVLITAFALLGVVPAGAVAWQGKDGEQGQEDAFGTGSDVVRVYRGTVVSVGQDGSIVADVRTRACPGRGAPMGAEDLPDSPASNTGSTTQSHRGPGGGYGDAGAQGDGNAADQQYGGTEDDEYGNGPRRPRGPGGGERGDRGRGRPAQLLNRTLTFKTDADTSVYR